MQTILRVKNSQGNKPQGGPTLLCKHQAGQVQEKKRNTTPRIEIYHFQATENNR